MSKLRYKSTSVTVETIVHCAGQFKTGATTPEIRDILGIIDGYDLGNKIYSIAVNEYLKKSKNGERGHNTYSITAKGKTLIKNHDSL